MIRRTIFGWMSALCALGRLGVAISMPSAAPVERTASPSAENKRQPLGLPPVSAWGVFDPSLAETPPGERM